MKKFLIVLALLTLALTLTACKKQSFIPSTPGVVYEISDDGSYAKVVGYTGTDTDVTIANIYEGLPVKAIGKEAFRNNCTITINFIIKPHHF